MRQVWVPCLFLLLVACREKAPADGALRVSVSYGSYTPGCVRVVVRDGQGHEGGKDIPRSLFQPRDTRELIVAVFRKPDWGREVAVEVSSHASASGEECTGAPVEVRSSAGPVSIPLGDFARTEVALLAKDDDGDSFLSPADGVAGTDCDDGRGDVHPGATELCSVNVDYDCNGSQGCQDSACQDQACDDGNACTTGDRCQGSGATAACMGQEVKCTQPTGDCLTGARCEPTTGQCVNIEAPQGTACDDGDECTLEDQCGPQARCTGTLKSCGMPPSQCHQTPGTCNSANGVCTYDFKPAAASCNDTVGCTVNDVCNGAGVCQGTMTSCTASSPCKRVTGGCPGLDNCTEEPDPSKVNTACMIDASRTGVCRMLDGVCSAFPYLPSNFNPDTVPLANIGTLTTTCDVTFDSTELTWAPTSCVTSSPTPVVVTEGGKEMVLVAMSSLNLGADLILRGTRPVILAVYGDASLNHSILANGTFVGGVPTPGAGGNQDCATRRGDPGVLANNAGGGGGGAGGGTAGAAGNSGRGSNGAGGGGGGAGSAGGGGLVPLVGGCPGGNGGGGAAEAGLGGAGGGAVQVSVARTLTVNQWVTASGGGGGGARGSTVVNGHAGGGGGGGSGGRVLLEANRLVLAGSTRLTANGGGGGEGAGYLDFDSQSMGENGEDGPRSSALQASGGNDGSYSGGNGGLGGALVGPTGGLAGESYSGSKGGGGGGGGAVGHIRLRSREVCSINGAIISPTTNTACPL
ncbi:putative metal-binding motif-containing protein [Hyalangium gracile]|uniref:putative metal-binding motif-containing protein n=1 Tax=Hyalangium gracile TaxID=394092 RepID=UPI001CCFFD25|nr:putative metal-binding motif-containing protein [Hyalangium gracile]